MFYLVDIKDHVRVEPKRFGLPTEEAVAQQLQETYADYYNKELGRVISVVDISSVGEGVIIPGDGAAYYDSEFKLLVWKPELQELVFGIIDEITNFGAFINLGVMKGMIHVSQTMEDYVSFNKANSLIGKSSKKSIKKGDQCLARIVAISHKGADVKIGLTMRQPGLGKLEWIKEEEKKREKEEKKIIKEEYGAVKGKGKGGKRK
ncbi:DNA-directed RNA polymerase [Candidatus Pacearchaeota archaeon]|nr:DNA-directed RNA polymerase [Candidatus Pacearchaeota archaeon]